MKGALSRLLSDNRAAEGTVNQLVVVAATLFVGIIVMANIGDAMPLANNDSLMFSDAFDSAESIIGSSLELAAILPLVIVAGGLLFYVSRFGGGGRR